MRASVTRRAPTTSTNTWRKRPRTSAALRREALADSALFDLDHRRADREVRQEHETGQDQEQKPDRRPEREQ